MVAWFTISVLACVFFFTIYLLCQYPVRGIPLVVYFFVFTGWFASFVIVTLIPYDVFLAKGGSGDKDLLELGWKIVYWTAFVLCWVILPITEKYHTSGEFTFFGKLKNAIFRQLRSIAIIVVLLIALSLYMIFAQGIQISRLPNILILTSNIWGLFLVIALLGYGLVFVPMAFWGEGNLEKSLKTLQLRSVFLDEAYIDSKFRLSQVISEILKLNSSVAENDPMKKNLEIMVSEFPKDFTEHQRVRPGSNRVTTHKDLVNLHEKLKSLLSETRRDKW